MSEETQVGEKLSLVIKASGNRNYEIEVNSSITVSELKEVLAEKSGIAVKQQRLIYSGRILKDSEQLSVYGIKSGNAIHLVKGAASKKDASPAGGNAAASGAAGGISGAPRLSEMSAGQETGNVLSDLTGARYSGLANLPSASLFGPDGGQGPMPSMEDINSMLAGNPELLDQLSSLMSQSPDDSPLFRALPTHIREEARTLLSNPEMRALISDPQRFREFMQTSLRMQQILSGDRPGAGFPSSGAGGTGSAGASGSASVAGLFGNPFAGVNLDALGGFGAGLGTQVPVERDTRPPEERYETQLRQLNELGFFDFDRNVQALRRSGGNVEGAVEALLDGHV